MLNVRADFGAVGDGTTNDSAAFTAAINAAAPSGKTVYIPDPPNYYRIGTALPLLSGVSFLGDSYLTTEVRAISCNMFEPLGNIGQVMFKGLRITAYNQSIFELGTSGARNGLVQSSFVNCSLRASTATASIVHGNGPITWQEIYVHDGDVWYHPAATVAPFSLVSTIDGLNGQVYEDLVVNGQNSSGAVPVWHVECAGPSSSQSFVADCTWRNIVGEKNLGGLVHLWSPHSVTLENVTDWDATTPYGASIVRIDTNAAGAIPQDVKIDGVGVRAGAVGTVNGTSVFHLEVASPTVNNVYASRINEFQGVPHVKSAPGVVLAGPSGLASAVRTVTTNYALAPASDGTVIFNGANLTATLPDPSTVLLGRPFTIKNANASAVTVASAGAAKTIDGAASQGLAQWAAGRYVSDGSQWVSV